MLIAADDRAVDEGIPPPGRSLSVPCDVLSGLGYDNFPIHGPLTPPLLERLRRLHAALYRPSDFHTGGLHGGVFMFRDVYCGFYIPLVYGTAAIDPFLLVSMSPLQKQWLKSRKTDNDRFLSTFIDVCDFAGGAYGLGDYKSPPKQSLDLFRLAGFQLQGAAATLVAAFDARGAVQSAIIGTELALKAGLVAGGHDPEKLRDDFGHNTPRAAEALAKYYPELNLSDVLAAMKNMPAYVKNRYDPQQPDRIETGDIVMAAQYVAGEVMRQVTKFSLRSAMLPTTEGRHTSPS